MVSYHFFTRHNGVSTGTHSSLNVSHGTGDDPDNIEKNRSRIRRWVGAQRLLSAHQIHSDRVYVDNGEIDHSHEVDGFDALISDQPGTALMIQQADCQAVLLSDPVNPAIAAVHNGWRGSVVNIIAATIEQMQNHFGTDPVHLQARISPSLGPCCAEFVNHEKELPESFSRFEVQKNHFDFWQISAEQLRGAGLQPESIHLSDVCTSCSKDYFSYRRAVREGTPQCGRHASVIFLGVDG
ncbi:MAG: peptidoglycan editing factor PgeF [Desulfobulbaceae bacterium]|nr:MAG: peptidoglycan editing factor PgeF [Desulfobulbaceae bacterium]